MRHYSLIIPVFNRPHQIKRLLECLSIQNYKNFEVIVVEDGSIDKSDHVVEGYSKVLNMKYLLENNKGQGFCRNRGMEEASGEYFIIFDSDILVPVDYLEIVNDHLNNHYLDAFGGPDRLHPDSSPFQKAVNYCMTSFLTTGGTRGSKNPVGRFYPRSFNMGVSREVYEQVGGFNIPFMGEDIEWSHRIINAGFKTELIEDAYVNHERKNSIKSFYKQIHFFGRARINISNLIPKSFKIIHSFPLLYCLYVFAWLMSPFISKILFLFASGPLILYHLLLLLSAAVKTKNLRITAYFLLCSNILMWGYCFGMVREFISLYVLKNKQKYQL